MKRAKSASRAVALSRLRERFGDGVVEVTVGIHDDEIHVDRRGRTEKTSSIARRLEFGTIKNIDGAAGAVIIPPRPFLRPAVDENSMKWRSIVDRGIRDGVNLLEIANKVGSVAVEDILASLIAVEDPPLSPKTLEARKRHGNDSNKPLIDTGQLFDQVTARVKRRK